MDTHSNPTIYKLSPIANCFNENKKHPYLYINSVHLELLLENPITLQFYEVINHSSMDTIEREMGPHATFSHM